MSRIKVCIVDLDLWPFSVRQILLEAWRFVPLGQSNSAAESVMFLQISELRDSQWWSWYTARLVLVCCKIDDLATPWPCTPRFRLVTIKTAQIHYRHWKNWLKEKAKALRFFRLTYLRHPNGRRCFMYGRRITEQEKIIRCNLRVVH